MYLYEQQISTGVNAVTECSLARQHWTVGNVFGPEQCGKALVLDYCTPL